jgi:HD-like signal output (HDOD) protein
MNEQLMEQIRQCPTLPSLPRVAVEIIKLTEDADAAIPALARIVSQDPALVAKVLRTVNSSFYGLSHTISSVEHALVVLGLDGVKTLVLSFSLVAGLKAVTPKGFDHLTYWRRSVYAAVAAKILADEFKQVVAEEAFLAALLMDIGMLALDQVLGAKYAPIVTRAGSHSALCALEMGSIGVTHADVVRMLAETWKLPPTLAVPMANHHQPTKVEDPGLKDLTDVVWLAGRCADVFVDPQPEWSLCDIRRVCVDRYGIDELRCDSILCKIGMRQSQLAPLFEIPVDPGQSYEAIVERASKRLVDATKLIQEHEVPSDKRRAPRYSRGGGIVLFPYTDGTMGDPLRAQFRDASAQGLGVRLSFQLKVGAQFVIRLPQKNGHTVPVLYAVVRSEKVGEREFAIGAELMCVLRTDGGPAAASGGTSIPANAPPREPGQRPAPVDAAATTDPAAAPKTEAEALERIRAAVLL